MIIRKSEFAQIVGRSAGAIAQATNGFNGNPPKIPVVFGKLIDTNSQAVKEYMLRCNIVMSDDEIVSNFGFSDRSPTKPKPRRMVSRKNTNKPDTKNTKTRHTSNKSRKKVEVCSSNAKQEEPEHNKFNERMAMAKLKKAEADAMQADMKARESRGQLVSRELFVDVAMSYLSELHARLLNEMPTAAAVVIAGLEQDENFLNKIEREIHDNTSSILKSSRKKIESLLKTHPQNEDFLTDANE